MLPVRSVDGFYHPSNEQELIELIRYARDNKITLRVRGSGHSVPEAIYTTGFPYHDAEEFSPGLVQNKYAENFMPVEVRNGQIDVLINKMRAITFFTDPDSGMEMVKVQAGCHLAYDPYDPVEESSFFDSFFYQLDKRGYAVPDTGGISHQTIGGFLSTGSSGGSLQRSIEESIYAFRFVDGNGEVHECSRKDNVDLFNAVGVSVGLLGIITEVTFTTVPRYDITGEEHIRPIKDYAGWIDFFGGGPSGFETFLKNTEYSRLLWWPQKGNEKMTVWMARQIKPNEYDDTNSIIDDGKRRLIPRPYREVTWVFGSPILFEYLGDLFYTAVSKWPVWLYKYVKNSWCRMFIQSTVESLWVKPLLPILIDAFVETDEKTDDGKWKPQRFWDTWWRGLPMDNQIDDKLMPVVFTEPWVPIEKTAEVMNAMRNYFDKAGLKGTGTFSTELYATKASEFWLSPSYKQDVFRVDVFMFGKDPGSPAEFYQQYWDLLAPYNFRCHWGKWIPGDPADPSDMKKWRDYMRKQFPMWDKFLELRDKLDPHQVFVTEYWRAKFGIERLPDRTVPPPQETILNAAARRDKRHESVEPNKALLTGIKNNPKTTVVMVVTSLLISTASVFAIEYIITHVLQWNSFVMHTHNILMVSLVSAMIGLLTVYTRFFSPIATMLIAFTAAIGANLINEIFNLGWFEWHAWMGIPAWIIMIVGELLTMVLSPLPAWFICQKAFKTGWPQK